MAVTIDTFRPIKDDRYLLIVERENPHPEDDDRLIITFERTIEGVRSMLAHLMDKGFSTGEVALITAHLRPVLSVLMEAHDEVTVGGRLLGYFS